jgi:anti-sigma-K factor RskA
MTNAQSHLTEEERHAFADGSLSPEQLPPIEAHLRDCAACALDVERIKTLMTRFQDTPANSTPAPLDAVWPSIRTRIEASKVIPLSATSDRIEGRRAPRRLGLAIAAAAVLVMAVALGIRYTTRPVVPIAQSIDTTSLIAVADSAHAYEEQAQTLLNQLELRRAMLRPEAVVQIDRDLRVVDSAIAELKEAIAHDPNNPALRRLLASSYRQKVDVLKRVGNAS